MTDHKIEVVALVVANDILTFYKTDGSAFTITQGDPRGRRLFDEFNAQRKLGVEIITLITGEDERTITHLNSKERNPALRFFRALKKDITKLFGGGLSPEDGTDATHEAAEQRVRDVAARLFKGDPATDATKDELPVRMVHDESPLTEEETIIAVTETGIVAEVENLSDQFQAGKEGKAPSGGPDNLLIRLANMSAKRGHTGQELMGFIKGIDLPILPDGSYLAYKRLLHIGNGVYVDPHSKKVHQRIGDIVQMDEKLVDPSRRTLCSTGLHIGTRSYMGSFHAGSEGSGTMLVLVEPEDTIAVPQYAGSKARVMRYRILADLSNKAHDLVNGNKRMDDCTDTMKIVAEIVAGARPQALGVVNIGGGYGSDLTYTVKGQSIPTNTSLEQARKIAGGQAVAPSAPVKDVRTIAEDTQGNRANLQPVKVRDNASKVKPVDAKATIKASTPTAGASERVKKAAELYARMTDKDNTDADRRSAAEGLKAHKQKTKVSYEALALPKTAGDEVQEILTIVSQPKKAEPKPAKPAPAPKQPAPKKQAPQTSTKVTPSGNTGVPAPEKGQTRQARARALWDVVQNSKDANHRKEAASQLRTFKKTAKVSWDALGLGKFNVEGTLAKLLD